MTTVFIAGSREISKLNDELKSRIDKIVEKGFRVLIGDANGADKAVQKYLSERDYGNVTVFCMKGQCRNNIGSWQTKSVDASKDKRGFEYYSTKDLEMAKETDYGFLIWDAKSKGTLNNAINLLKLSKKVLVYFYPEKSFHVLDDFDDLKHLLLKCDKAALELFEKKLHLSEVMDKDEQSTLEFAQQESF